MAPNWSNGTRSLKASQNLASDRQRHAAAQTMSEYCFAHHKTSEMLAGQTYDMRSLCPFSPELRVNETFAMYNGVNLQDVIVIISWKRARPFDSRPRTKTEGVFRVPAAQHDAFTLKEDRDSFW